MAKFEKPIEGERFIMNIDKTKGQYDNLSVNINVIAPFSGKVVDSTRLNCNGSFKIEHKVGDKKFFSNFCNLGNQRYLIDNEVIIGKKIGETVQENLEYWITSENREKQNLEDFFAGRVLGMEDKKEEEKKEKKDDGKEKKEKKEDPYKKQSKSSSSSSSSSKSSFSIPTDGEFKPEHSLFLSPLRAALSPFQKKSLSEEINRMKKLMK